MVLSQLDKTQSSLIKGENNFCTFIVGSGGGFALIE